MKSFMTIFRLNERAATETGTPKESCSCNSSASKKSSSGHTIGRHRFLFQSIQLSKSPDHSVCNVLAGKKSTNFKDMHCPCQNKDHLWVGMLWAVWTGSSTCEIEKGNSEGCGGGRTDLSPGTGHHGEPQCRISPASFRLRKFRGRPGPLDPDVSLWCPVYFDSSSICFSKLSIVESSTIQKWELSGGTTTKITRIIDSNLKSL